MQEKSEAWKKESKYVKNTFNVRGKGTYAKRKEIYKKERNM